MMRSMILPYIKRHTHSDAIAHAHVDSAERCGDRDGDRLQSKLLSVFGSTSSDKRESNNGSDDQIPHNMETNCGEG